jgi:Ca2+-binding RTX toxin-like protein
MSRSKRRLAGALVAALALGASATAHADTTATVSGSTLYVSAAPGRANDITLFQSPQWPGRIRISDGGDFMRFGAGCSPITMTCTTAVSSIMVKTDDLDDTVTKWGPIATIVDGGIGDDVLDSQQSLAFNRLIGSDGNDRLSGGPTTDVLDGGAGNDLLNGYGGNDHLIGGAGSDRMLGGFGDDALDGLDAIGGNDRLDGEAGVDACRSDAGDLQFSC